MVVVVVVGVGVCVGYDKVVVQVMGKWVGSGIDVGEIMVVVVVVGLVLVVMLLVVMVVVMMMFIERTNMFPNIEVRSS